MNTQTGRGGHGAGQTDNSISASAGANASAGAGMGAGDHLRRSCAAMLCPLLLALCAPGQADELGGFGRLLTTPVQRSTLDQLRKNTGKALPANNNAQDDIIILPPASNPANSAAAAPAKVQAPQSSSTIVFNGFVKRSAGPGTSWLNQTAMPAQALHQRNGALALHLPLANGKSAELKAGQGLLLGPAPEQAVLLEALPAGALTINHHASPAAGKNGQQ